MTYSRTWVLCANPTKAKLYRLDVALGAIERIFELKNESADFATDLAAEVEYACGHGSTEQIVLCGEFRLVSRVCQRVEDGVRGRIAGLINQDLVEAVPETVRLLAQPAIVVAPRAGAAPPVHPVPPSASGGLSPRALLALAPRSWPNTAKSKGL